MDPLLEELVDRGIIDPTGALWAEAFAVEQDLPTDWALLELDLVHEDDLLGALAQRYGLPAATPTDLLPASAEVVARLPDRVGRSFGICPVRGSGSAMVALVSSPVPPESVQELLELFDVELHQRIAPSHYIALARPVVYGGPVDRRARALQNRLHQRRSAPPVSEVLTHIRDAPTLDDAVQAVIEFGQNVAESIACWHVQDGRLRFLGSSHASGETILAPPLSASVGPAILHGGYFLGPLAGSEDDDRFYAGLGRSPPRVALVSPAPGIAGGTVVVYVDNGHRGLATRWVAELMLLSGALRGSVASPEPMESVAPPPSAGTDRHPGRAGSPTEIRAPGSRFPMGALIQEDEEPEPELPVEGSPVPELTPPLEPATEAVVPAPEPTNPPSEAPSRYTEAEHAALARLKVAAARAGREIGPYLDELLAAQGGARDAQQVGDLAGEVRDLFSSLATSIPAQLAQGMEVAFRDLTSRLAVPAAAPPMAAPPVPAGGSPRPSADVELVRSDPAPREVPSYRQRRRKSKRIKL